MPRLKSMNCWCALLLLAAPAWAENSVAVIASLSGRAEALAAGSHAAKPAAALDWLADGDTLQLGPHSQAVLILFNGHRYELHGGARATVSANAAPKITGPVRELSALPPIPRFAPVAAVSAPTPGAPAIRGGGAEMTGLYPRAGAAVLPDQVILRYKAVPEAASYGIALEDNTGRAVWNATTEATTIAVPGGTLEAGAHYSWRVRALRSGTEIGAGMQEFDTLSAEESLRRDEFREAARASSNGPETLALLAEIDLRLGLLAEGCGQIETAIEQKPGDDTLRRLARGCELVPAAK